MPVWQRLVLPAQGLYTIEAAGARGYGGCRGASIKTVFELQAGTTIYMLIGQVSSWTAGGGGTFVLHANGTALVVGGGGGVAWNTYGPGCDASLTSTDGKPSSAGVGGGSNGGGGKGRDCSGAAGLYGDGNDDGGCGGQKALASGRSSG